MPCENNDPWLAPSALDNSNPADLPSLILAILWSAPPTTTFSAQQLVDALNRAGITLSPAKVHASLTEMTLSSHPWWPFTISPRSGGYALVPKSPLHLILATGFSIEPLSELEMACLAAILYWHEPRPPTAHHLTAIFDESRSDIVAALESLIHAGWIYPTHSYDHYRRFRPTRAALDRLGVRTKNHLPKFKEIRDALIKAPSASDEPSLHSFPDRKDQETTIHSSPTAHQAATDAVVTGQD